MNESQGDRFDPGPAPTAGERRELLRQGHPLKARLMVGRDGLTESFIHQVHQALAKAPLVKVRLDAEDAAGADELADDMASRIPCHLLRRVGRVALLYRPQPGSAS